MGYSWLIENIDLLNVIDKTKYGSDGIGGIITNGTMVDYAKKRIKDHIGRFTKLYNQIKKDNIISL